MARERDYQEDNSMDMVFQKTRELGQAIAESDVYKHMKEIEDRALQNAEAAETMSKYMEKRTQIQEMLTQESPDPAVMKALSDEMDALQERLNMIDVIVELTEARNEFTNLINQVNQVLQFIVTGKMEDVSNCTGSCATCGGGCQLS